MSKIKYIVVCLLLGTVVCQAQNYPITNQYMINPYFYNPATIGNSGYKEVNLSYRQQWSGIADAPTVKAVNAQLPTYGNLDFGINFYDEYAVLLNTTTVTVGMAYRVNLGDQHLIKFGLSAGVGFNNFDIDEVDNPNDPAVYDVMDQTTFLSGAFGVHYQYKKLKLGLALPQIFTSRAVDTESFQEIRMDQFDNYILTGSYYFDLGLSPLGIEPYVQYRENLMSKAVVEAGAIANYKDMLFLGASYRKDYGGIGLFGLNLKENILLSYSYEFANQQQLGLGSGSHEFNLRFRFGGYMKDQKRNKALVKENNVRNVGPVKVTEVDQSLNKRTYSPEADDPISQGNEDIQVEENAVTNSRGETTYEFAESPSSINEEFEDANEPPLEDNTDEQAASKVTRAMGIDAPSGDFEPGYYVVLGGFRVHNNAVLFTRMLNGKHISAKYGYVGSRDLYYVYSLHTMSFDEARRLRNSLKKLKEFNDVWIYSVAR